MERYNDLRAKDVVNVCDGNKLGKVIDLVVDTCNGRIIKLIVGEWGILACFCYREKEYRIPWSAICRIGEDTILVEVDAAAICHDRDGRCD